MDFGASAPQPRRRVEPAEVGAAVLASASQAILGVDQSNTIVLANPAAERVFGYVRDELVGAELGILLPMEQREAHRARTAGYFANPHVRAMGLGLDLRGRHKDGHEFPVEVSLSYVDTSIGRMAVAFVTDISARRQLEDQLSHAQKMEAIGRLAGGLAHDFNNLLTIINGYGNLLADELGATSPLHDHVEQIIKAGERAGALTAQLLSLSRRPRSRLNVVEVNAVVAEMAKMLRPLLGDAIELKLRLEPDAGNIQIEQDELERALVNLATNARDAMPGGGRVLIETRAVALDQHYTESHFGVMPGRYAMIAVSDTGSGMDAETKRKIFEPFFTTKAMGRGTGLGLASVYGLVKHSGGDIWVYSEIGCGTTFKLYFPLVGEASSATPAPLAPPTRARREPLNVLLVEDDAGVRELTEKMLLRQGHRVRVASNGEQAIARACELDAPVHVLVTDLVMPGMSGRQVAGALQLLQPNVRVVYLSGYTAEAALEKGMVEPDDEFLTKPFSIDALLNAIDRVLDGA